MEVLGSKSAHSLQWQPSLTMSRSLPTFCGPKKKLFSCCHFFSLQSSRLISISCSTKNVKANGKTSSGLDFFAAHFNEELSALDGDALRDQIEHVNLCIAHILSLYEAQSTTTSPKSVMVLGHSMGGFVARALFTSPTYLQGSVRTIVTLNTPHRYIEPIPKRWSLEYCVVLYGGAERLEDLKRLVGSEELRISIFLIVFCQRIIPLLLQRSVADLYHNVNGYWLRQFNSSSYQTHRYQPHLDSNGGKFQVLVAKF